MSADRPAGLRESKKQAVRERLYSAALDLFRKHGYDAVSVQAACEAAGVAKGTFFNHFPTKEHLLFEWYRRLNAAGETALAPAPGPLGGRLAEFASGYIRPAAADAPLWLEKLARSGLHADLRAEERRADQAVRARCAEMIREARSRGEVRAGVDPDRAAALFVALVTGTVKEWALCEGAFDPVARIESRAADFAALLAPDDGTG